MEGKRFMFYFDKVTDQAIVRWNGRDIRAKDIDCYVRTKTRWSENTPRMSMTGYAKKVEFVAGENKIIIT